MSAPRRALLVAHTHWDREWYRTCADFRVDLVRTVDAVLDALDNDFDLPHFLLDGQNAVLDDYLTARPEARDRVHRLVREGRLATGPWYVLPDEFLVSGEATARNLLWGARTSPLGHRHAVGYMPDSFGHVAQMPQVLALADLDGFVFARGMDDRTDTVGWIFRWCGPDGSEVLALNPAGGYDNAGALGHAEYWHAQTARAVDPAQAVETVGRIFADLAGRPGGEPALLMHGSDHALPPRETGRMLAALREAWPDTAFEPGTLTDALAAARAEMPDTERPVLAGELLGGRDHPILSGVWSARMPLKQANAACQDLLTRVAEPLLAAAWLRDGAAWPGGLLDLAWRDLLRNHPHDSICGCSIDPVHKEMEVRYARVQQAGKRLVAGTLQRWAPTCAPQPVGDRDVVLCLANPLPRRRDAVIDRLVILPHDGPDPARLRVLDADGDPVPCEVREVRHLERFWGIDYRTETDADLQQEMLTTYLHRFGDRIIGNARSGPTHDAFVTLRLHARDLPAVGHTVLRLVEDDGPEAPAPPEVFAAYEGDGARLDNKHISVLLHPDGTLDLTHKATGRKHLGLNLLEDTEDRGDSYDYCPAPATQSFFSAGCEGKVRLRDRSRLRGAAEASFRFDLPRSLDPDRRGRHHRTTPCDVTVQVTLDTGSPLVDVTTTINNRAFDHRLRTWFPSGLAAETVVSDGVFGLDTRPLLRPGGEDWTQPAPRTWPQQDFSLLSDGKAGLAVLAQGLPEIETLDAGDGTAVLAVTLLRGVDWLSRDDLPTRNHINAGPTLHVPDAQVIGRHTFRYALLPFEGEPLTAGVKTVSDAWRTPVPVVQGVLEGSVAGGEFLLEVDDPRVAVTAIKRAEREANLVVRLVNLSGEDVTARLAVGVPVDHAAKTSLLETPLHVFRDDPTVTHGGRQVRVPLAPHEIATLNLEFAPAD